MTQNYRNRVGSFIKKVMLVPKELDDDYSRRRQEEERQNLPILRGMTKMEVHSIQKTPLIPQTGRSTAFTTHSPTSMLQQDATKRFNLGIRFASNQRERVQNALLENSMLESTPSKLCDGNT